MIWLSTIIGFGLILSGIFWETNFGPSLIGWGFIIGGIVWQRFYDGQKWRKEPLFWPLLILIFIALFSLLITANFPTTFQQVNRLLVGIVAYFAFINWARTQENLRKSIVGFIVLGVALALISPVAVAWHESKIGLIPERVYQLFPLLLPDAVHPNVMAALMLLLVPIPMTIATGYFLNYRILTRWQYGMTVAATLSMMLILLLTLSRGGYLGIFLAIVTMLLLFRRYILGIVVAFTGATVATLLLINEVSQSTIVDALTEPASVAFRLQVWETAVNMISDFPFTGVGMGTFNDVGSRLYPFPIMSNPGTHNLYLQIGVELGIIGMIAFFAMLILIVSMGWISIRRLRKMDDSLLLLVSIGAFSSIIGMMVHGLVDSIVWGTRMAFMPWLLFGLLVALFLYTEDQNKKQT